MKDLKIIFQKGGEFDEFDIKVEEYDKYAKSHREDE